MLPGTLCSTFATSIGAAMSGAGMAMAHDSLVVEALADGRLVRPFLEKVQTDECYYLIEPLAHLKTPASGTLTDRLKAEFATAS